MDKHATEQRKLPVKLTEHELAEKGRAMATLITNAAEIEDMKRDAVSEFNDRIASAYQLASEIAAVVNAGAEDRDVEVRLVFDFASNSVTVSRQDTGEVVEERAMTAHEREEMAQIHLPVTSIEVVPSCPECGHLEDMHAEAYASPAGDDGTKGEKIRLCSIDGCRCSRPMGPELISVGVVDHPTDPNAVHQDKQRRKPRGKHAAAGEGASA